MKKRFYFLSIFILFLFNINIVNANSLYLGTPGGFFNNNGSSINSVTTYYDTNEIYTPEITTLANSYGALVVYKMPFTLVKGHIYSMYAQVAVGNEGGYTMPSSRNCLAIGGSVNGAANNYVSSCITPKFTDYVNSTQDNARGLYFTFIADRDGIFIAVPYTSQYTCNNCYNYSNGINIVEIGDSNSLSEGQVNSIINNQTNNFKSIINNQSTSIENAIQESTQQTQESIKQEFETCPNNLVEGASWVSGALDINGNVTNSTNSYYTSNYIKIDPNSTYTISDTNSSVGIGNVILYDSSKNYIDYWPTRDRTFTTTSDTAYFRVSTTTINLKIYKGTGEFKCTNKLDSLNDTQKETNQKLDNLNDNITNSDSSQATDDASDFFSNFNTDTFGLTSVITAPLELIKSVTSKSCTPLHGTLPFVSTEINLPCLSTIYENHFGVFLNIYRTITFGFVSYWVCIKIFNLVKDFKNPEHDEIEVLDL